ncbi:MAG: prolyl oligopeptidase family serine peptidase [Planctomycetales bacterium]|nr:prolyl oligopeptidase family serine peptidase [Planctomycetales bacterium]
MKRIIALILCAGLSAVCFGQDLAKTADAPPQRRFRGQQQERVYKSRIAPHWFHDNEFFWYRNELRGGSSEFILVDAVQGTRRPAFDHTRLAKALTGAGVADVRPDRLPFDSLEFDDELKSVSFVAAGKKWKCDLENYEVSGAKDNIGSQDDSNTANRLDNIPRRSRRTGPETELQFVNESGGPVELFWLDDSGRRQAYGRLAAGESKRQHTYAGHVWLAVHSNGTTVAAFEADELEKRAVITNSPVQPRSQRRRSRTQSNGGASPDGQWRAFVNDGNVFVRNADGEDEVQLTEDGNSGSDYQMLDWSPNSRAFVAFRVEPGDRKEVYLVESSPNGGGRAVLHQRRYPLPGDRFSSHELHVFKLDENDDWSVITPDVEPIDFGWPRVRWNADGSKFTYIKNDRGHQRYRLIEVDANSGEARNVLDEQTNTFIWTAHAENVDVPPVTWLDETDEIIYASEVDGWRHLFLIDANVTSDDSAQPQITNGEKRLFAAGLKNQITTGQFVVRGVDQIDEQNRQIWFRASGKNSDQDPYFIHHYRVNFDGSELTALTDGNGNHSVQFSPDHRFLIDTYSRVDMPSFHELRRAEDGQLVCKLEAADVSELEENGWQSPEVFVAKGRDGQTDIWGIICRPANFDPSKRYPVIEDLYAGPHSAYVPKSFSSRDRYEALNDQGFIVVKIDGMGTAHRSKAFHDVCWHNLKDAGFEDRIRWIKAAAEKYPYLDLDRVGVYGVSAGGQNAGAAVLFHGDFYKVAVAGCGCHDNRMDKSSWNEQWMGYPVGPQYSASSNIDNAHLLQGKLLLIVGEMDNNVPPESTLRFADALIKANKEFDMLVVPGAGHGIGGAYGQRRMHQFFVHHLLDNNDPPTDTAVENEIEESAELDAGPKVSTPPESFFDIVRERDREVARQFYSKYIDIQGIPVVASPEVADEALQRTHDIVSHMLAGRPDVVQSMIDDQMYLIIIGKDQVYTDMPENRNARDPDYLNERVRGTGGKPTSFGEENLLGWPIDRYDDESIAVHEFCHTVDRALRRIDPTWNDRRNATYEAAIAKGLWKGSYAASNPGEYWAEIAQTYFDSQRVNNWNHGPIGTREQLKEYDPVGYELVRSAFRLNADQDWRYTWPQKLPNVTRPPAVLKIDPYYTKFTWAREFTVLGRDASDEAMLKANDTIRKMFAYRHDILKALIADGVQLVVLGKNESLSDLPQLTNAKNSGNVDLLARMLDYSPETKLLVVSEENVLGDPRDPLIGYNQVIRVFAKALYRVTGTRPVDPNWENRPRHLQQQYELGVTRLDIRFDGRLEKQFSEVTEAGRWKGTEAFHDREAYWVAGVLAYFNAGQSAAPNDAPHPISTREELSKYDPGLYELVTETMAYTGHVDWRFDATASRP